MRCATDIATNQLVCYKPKSVLSNRELLLLIAAQVEEAARYAKSPEAASQWRAWAAAVREDADAEDASERPARAHLRAVG